MQAVAKGLVGRVTLVYLVTNTEADGIRLARQACVMHRLVSAEGMWCVLFCGQLVCAGCQCFQVWHGYGLCVWDVVARNTQVITRRRARLRAILSELLLPALTYLQHYTPGPAAGFGSCVSESNLNSGRMFDSGESSRSSEHAANGCLHAAV